MLGESEAAELEERIALLMKVKKALAAAEGAAAEGANRVETPTVSWSDVAENKKALNDALEKQLEEMQAKVANANAAANQSENSLQEARLEAERNAVASEPEQS